MGWPRFGLAAALVPGRDRPEHPRPHVTQHRNSALPTATGRAISRRQVGANRSPLIVVLDHPRDPHRGARSTTSVETVNHHHPPPPHSRLSTWNDADRFFCRGTPLRRCPDALERRRRPAAGRSRLPARRRRRQCRRRGGGRARPARRSARNGPQRRPPWFTRERRPASYVGDDLRGDRRRASHRAGRGRRDVGSRGERGGRHGRPPCTGPRQTSASSGTRSVAASAGTPASWGMATNSIVGGRPRPR